MPLAIIELAVIILKILYSIVKAIISWKEEERRRFEERIRTLSGILKEAIVNKEESLNEEDYLSNLAWENQQRYLAYKKAAERIISSGGGINELTQEEIMGMGQRVIEKRDEVVAVLIKDLYIIDRAKLIGKTLLGV